MITDQLRRLGAIPFDITVLQNIYPDCSCVCDKARRLVMQGDIIRLKKGMYVLSSMDIPLSKELIANLLYGPSYVSMNWALSYWGLIPERVHLVESVLLVLAKPARNTTLSSLLSSKIMRLVPVIPGILSALS